MIQLIPLTMVCCDITNTKLWNALQDKGWNSTKLIFPVCHDLSNILIMWDRLTQRLKILKELYQDHIPILPGNNLPKEFKKKTTGIRVPDNDCIRNCEVVGNQLFLLPFRWWWCDWIYHYPELIFEKWQTWLIWLLTVVW
jgi:hypothetical protein